MRQVTAIYLQLTLLLKTLNNRHCLAYHQSQSNRVLSLRIFQQQYQAACMEKLYIYHPRYN